MRAGVNSKKNNLGPHHFVDRRGQGLYEHLRLLPSPDTVVQLGAGAGQYVGLWASLGAAQMVLVEPDPSQGARLRGRLEGVPNVVMMPVWVGEHTGSQALIRWTQDRFRSVRPATGLSQLMPGLQAVDEVEVETLKADDFWGSVGLPETGCHWLIIDMPGEEGQLIESLLGGDFRHAFSVVVLTAGAQSLYRGAVPAESVISLLMASGYRMEVIDDADQDWPQYCLSLDRMAVENEALRAEVERHLVALTTSQSQLVEVKARLSQQDRVISQLQTKAMEKEAHFENLILQNGRAHHAKVDGLEKTIRRLQNQLEEVQGAQQPADRDAQMDFNCVAQNQQRVVNQANADDLSARLYSILDALADNVLRDGKDMVLDGVRTFDTKDPFLPGKLALAFSYRVTACATNEPELTRALRQFEQVVDFTSEDPLETWGISFYLQALVRLKKHGVLDKSMTPDQLDRLRQQLDWRGFVDEGDYQLQNLSFNYYGVALAIAEYRATLGWDDRVHAEILLQRVLHDYRKYSHPYGFADETEGHGRYDRYSVLLIAEIAQHLGETGRPLTSEMRSWLHNSAQFVLVNLNKNGDGFQFGRSIGAYGDTAFLEILSAAAWHGVLTGVEARMAYAFCRRSTRKFLDFWYDKTRQSINLWDDGRATDGYRNKRRILGENLSLLHQQIYTNVIWEQLGFKPNPQLDEEFVIWLQQLPRYSLTHFSKKYGPKAVLTVRDKNRVFSLWLVNPTRYHGNGAYAPAPFSPGLIQALPNQAIYPLIPIVELEDGTQVLPLAYFDDIHLEEREGQAILSCAQTGLATVKEGKLSRDERVSVQSRFVFSPGAIHREDKFTVVEASSIAAIQLKFPVFESAHVEDHTAILGSGKKMTFHVTGYDELRLEDPADSNASSTTEGRIRTCLHAKKTIRRQLSTDTSVSWTFKYR